MLRTKVSCCYGRVPKNCLMMIHRGNSLMLSGLKAHCDRTQIIDVFKQSSIDLFFQPQNDRYRKVQRKTAVAQSVTDGSKWLSRSRGGVQVYEVNIASGPADRFP